MKRFARLLVAGAIGVLLSSVAFGQGGVVLLGGDDLQQHGSRSGAGVNQTGWLYIENGLRSMAPQVRRAGPFSVDIVALTTAASTPTGFGDGAAIASAAANAGLTVQFVDGTSEVTAFFASLTAGTINPKIIWIPGNNGSGGTDSSEEAVLAANASVLNAYVGSGGGLFAHTGEYSWLAAVLPGSTIGFSCDSSTLTLTPPGQSVFPTLTNTDIQSGPCHNNFLGNIGGLQVLAADGDGNAIIIGGITGSGGLTDPGGSTHHPISCLSGPLTVGVAVPHGTAVTSTLPAPVFYTIASGNLGAGLSFFTSGGVAGTPQFAGTFPYTIIATGNDGVPIHAQCQLTVVNPASAVSILSACPLNTATVGSAFSQTLSASGGTGALTFSLASGSLPAGLTLSSAGVVSGTATGAETAAFTLLVTDSLAQSATKVCSMTTSAAPVGPAITTSCPMPNGTVNVHYSQALTATGTNPISWSITSGALPAGLSLSSAGLISGNPHHDGVYSFTLSAANTVSAAAQACSITIGLVAPPVAPSITTACPLTSATVGSVYSQSFAATGGVGALTFSLLSGAVPAGLTLTSGGVLSGTPTAAGTASFTVQVADSSTTPLTGSKACSVIVNAAPPAPIAPTITSACPLPNGTHGTSYHTVLSATGTSPITWTLTAGTLPVGLALASAGSVSGVPGVAGVSSFTLTATNAGGSVSQACSVTINAASGHSPHAPSINNSCPLTSATVGSAYSQTFTSTNGFAPLSYSISSGALPAGLTLSPLGVLSGTPTVAGTGTFTVLVTDSTTPTPQTGAKACSLVVNAAPVPPVPGVAPTITTACPLPDATELVHYSLTVAATGGTAPYTFSLFAGELPRPMTHSAGGVISGAPFHAGLYNFTLHVAGADGLTSQKVCSLTVVAAGGAISESRGGLRYGTETSAGIVPVEFELTETLPYTVSGRAYLVGRSKITRESSDIQFVTGGREADFVIEAGQTKAKFTTDDFGIRIGDHSAELVLSIVLEANGSRIPVDLRGTEAVRTGADH